MGVSNSSAVLDVVMEMHRKRGSVWQSKTLQEVAELVLDGRLSNAAGGGDLAIAESLDDSVDQLSFCLRQLTPGSLGLILVLAHQPEQEIAGYPATLRWRQRTHLDRPSRVQGGGLSLTRGSPIPDAFRQGDPLAWQLVAKASVARPRLQDAQGRLAARDHGLG